jgi:hypothetical protein
MFTDFQRQLTYYGVLDDVVDRYPWPTSMSLQAIQQQLITSAIYGKQILINDGYLVANPMLLQDLRDIRHSLIGVLLDSGTARLFTRSGKTNLAEGIERTSEHVATHRKLVSDRKIWPILRGQLDIVSKRAAATALPWPADKNMGEIFYLLMERIAASDHALGSQIVPPGMRDDFDAIFRRFQTMLSPQFDGARNYWEEACWQHFAGYDIDPHALGTIRMEQNRIEAFPEYTAVRPFMNIANEVYHLAYSAGAARSVALRGETEAPDTIIGMASAFVTAFPDLAGAERVTRGEGIGEAKLQALNQLLISLPGDIEFGNDFDFVAEIRLSSDVRLAGDAYLDGLEAFCRDAIDFDAMLKLRDGYVAELSRRMAKKLRRGASYLAGDSLSDLLVAAVTSPLHYAGGWLLGLGTDILKNKLIERMLEARVSAALTSEGVAAASTGIDRRTGEMPVPLARKMGLYLGPLKQPGMKALTDKVSPHPDALKPRLSNANDANISVIQAIDRTS